MATPPGSPLPPDALGKKLPIPDDPAAAPDALFEGTIYDDPKNLAIWLPPGRTLRGVLLLNGSANKPNPDDIAAGKKWRAEQAQDVQLAARQMASSWDFALITGTTWTEANRSSSDQQIKEFEAALATFATKTGHPEIPNLPIAFQGGSRFSGFGPMYAQKRPGRVIAYVLEVAGAPMPTAESKGVPGLIIPGSDDGGQGKIDSGFYPPRAAGAYLGAAMNWGAGHECASCRDLSWPFFDHAIRARLPKDADATKGPPALTAIDETTGWLGDTAAWASAWSWADYPGDRTKASWLPNRAVANVWRGYTLKEPAATFVSPTKPYKWGGGFAQDPSSTKSTDVLELVADLKTPPDGEVRVLDGDVDLGAATVSADGKKATLGGVKLAAGLHVFVLMKDNVALSRPAGLVVIP